jgi:hypothetical protein
LPYKRKKIRREVLAIKPFPALVFRFSTKYEGKNLDLYLRQSEMYKRYHFENV